MKGLGILALGFFLLVAAGCSSAPVESLLIDSFEGEINKQTIDYGTSEGTVLMVSADIQQKVCGEQSLKIEYDLKPSGYMWIARGYNLDVKSAAQWLITPQQIVWKKYNAISLQMYGSNSGSVVAFDIKDAGGEVWRFLIDDDFSGWKEIVCLFSGFFVRKDWQPETAQKNDTIDFPIMSFQFEPRLPGKGMYYFDCVKLVRVKE
ncbi:MAG: carbohydrate binding domain-containing protein [Candidatus Omnitrophota bacterium]